MTIAGQGGTDIIRSVLGNVVNVFKKKRAICSGSCDGMVLKMHYQWSFWLFLAGFSSVWYSWYHRDVIVCVSHFNADTQVRMDYINICLSYIYVDLGNDEKRFLLFYRWIHWTLLVLAFCFYIPRKMSKSFENPKIKKLIEDLATQSQYFDKFYEETERKDKEKVETAARYLAYNLGTHNGLFYKFFVCNIISLLIDIFCLFFLDFVFQGRFMQYGFMVYPFVRDPETLTDPMSITFPPFVNCEITREYMLTGQRNEIFGCHLTVMELYEKIFFFVWLWLIALMMITCGYLIFLVFLYFTWFTVKLLSIHKPRDGLDSHISEIIVSVLRNCRIGDIYLLYRFKQHLGHTRYYDLLCRMNNEKFLEMWSKDPADRPMHDKTIDSRPRNATIRVPKSKNFNNNQRDFYM